MTRDVIVVPPELSLASAWRVMTSRDIRHLPVVRAGALIGMLSDRDVMIRSTMTEDGVLVPAPDLIVGEAMTTTPLVSCEPQTDVRELVRIMIGQKIDAIPVVHGLRLVGLVTSTDLLALLLGQPEPLTIPFDFRLVDHEAHAYES
ncbi:MAG: CBS domain-containing protein [Deltaproteobacteria bacterium]|nr:CBS domain-containing protein [Deltaproteobacteria bacterium]